MKTGDDSSVLQGEELTLLGGFYCNSFRPKFNETGHGCQVSAGPMPYGALSIMAVVILSFFVGMWILIATKNARALTAFFQVCIIVSGLIAVVGPIVVHVLTIRKQQSLSPLLEFNKARRTISVHKGLHVIPLCDVKFLLLIAVPTADMFGAEVQLIVDSGEQRSRLLVDSVLSSTTSVFKKTYMPFAECAGIRLLNAECKRRWLGWQTSPPLVTELVHQSSEAA